MNLRSRLWGMALVGIASVAIAAGALLSSTSPAEQFQKEWGHKLDRFLLKLDFFGKHFLGLKDSRTRIAKSSESTLLPLRTERAFVGIDDLGLDDLRESLCTLVYTGNTKLGSYVKGERDLRICYFLTAPKGFSSKDQRLNIAVDVDDSEVIDHEPGKQVRSNTVDTFILGFLFMGKNGEDQARYFRATHQLRRDEPVSQDATAPRSPLFIRHNIAFYRSDTLDPNAFVAGAPIRSGLKGVAVTSNRNRTIALISLNAHDLCGKAPSSEETCPMDPAQIRLRLARTLVTKSNSKGAKSDDTASTFLIGLASIEEKQGNRFQTIHDLMYQELGFATDKATLKIDEEQFLIERQPLPAIETPENNRWLDPFSKISAWLVDRFSSDLFSAEATKQLSGSASQLSVSVRSDISSISSSNRFGYAVIGMLLVGSLIFFVAFGLLIQHYFISPVLRLEREVDGELGRQDSNSRLKLSMEDRTDELGTLSATFANLIRRIRSNSEKEEQFFALQLSLMKAIGHEIASPLQSLDASIDESNSNAKRQILRMKGTLEAIRDASDVASAFERRRAEMRVLRLRAFLELVVQGLSTIGLENISLKCADDVECAFDETLLEDVLVNILGNANRFRFSGTPIRVSALLSKDQVQIEISNQGPTIEAELIPRIFEFGVTRSDRGKHQGLGLFVSRVYLALMGGSIAVENLSDGVRFLISLPMESSGFVK